jgi:hypothetical protein
LVIYSITYQTQIPGHCVILEKDTGKIISGYHTENFEVVPEDEESVIIDLSKEPEDES